MRLKKGELEVGSNSTQNEYVHTNEMDVEAWRFAVLRMMPLQRRWREGKFGLVVFETDARWQWISVARRYVKRVGTKSTSARPEAARMTSTTKESEVETTGKGKGKENEGSRIGRDELVSGHGEGEKAIGEDQGRLEEFLIVAIGGGVVEMWRVEDLYKCWGRKHPTFKITKEREEEVKPMMTQDCALSCKVKMNRMKPQPVQTVDLHMSQIWWMEVCTRRKYV